MTENRFGLRSILLFLAVLLGVWSVGVWAVKESMAADASSAVWLTGKLYQAELERPLAATWTREEFRKILLELSRLRGVSVVLDRRLDPSAEVAVNLTEAPLIDGLKQLAELSRGEISLPENVVYIGPHEAAKKLRTVIELRRRELQTGLGERRRKELQDRRNVEWHDLDSPRDILRAIAQSARVKISNLDAIPHDLWAKSTLPDVTLVEALSIVLIQFDQTFEWVKAGDEIELIPLPDRLSSERKFRPPKKAAETLAKIQDTFPELDVEIAGTEIVVQGFVEDHEAVAQLLQGKSRAPLKKKEAGLRQQMFTLKVQQPVSVLTFMRTLEEKGIRFDYSEDELKAADVNLERPIQLDVKNVSAEHFFQAIFDPVQLSFQLDGMTVKLKPKPAKKGQE